MARRQRVPITRRPVTAALDVRGLAGYRYVLAVVLLVVLSSGPVLLLVGAGMSSLGHWPPALSPPAVPAEATTAGGADPFVTFPPPPRPDSVVPLPCHAAGGWQVLG